MLQLIDLTRPLQPLDKASFPKLLMPLFRILSPEVEYIDHKAGAKIMSELFGCTEADLPDAEGWTEENVSLSTHLGTHVDAPWHYGSTCAGKRAKTIDEAPLEDLYCDAVVLDMTAKRGSGEAITTDDLERALAAVDYRIKPGDAVLIRTDHDKYEMNDPVRYLYPGLTRESALWLAEQGAKVGGTDATGWDRPFPMMIRDYQTTRDKRYIWDAHYALREVEFYVVQQLANLDKLPPHGFKVSFFPLKLVGASAAPARVVAFVES
jgi:kynurenine formamidase